MDDEKGATMGVRIEVGSTNQTCGSLSAAQVSSDLIEIHLSADGNTSALRLTKAEAEVFSLTLSKLAADAGNSRLYRRPREETGTTTRDELIAALLTLPRDSEIDLQIGTEHIAITGVAPWGGKNWAALQCHRADIKDLLGTWQVPAQVMEKIVGELPQPA
ncbi:hypothetical protein GCM10010435_37740 [Winogradskya consettensis]|uniref:Uncharacterized protein n=1 Tax=Winogradskya consettensis TaxID=113560 RepID=A0A919T2Y2_9ACTN|nr:hypothetical protein [Actinoplanes consettensis]GIM83810.1 hypothetical protein Aco04nite_88350 [Actinoplanes consettensis]